MCRRRLRALACSLTYAGLRNRVLELEFDKGINPTDDEFASFFGDLHAGATDPYESAKLFFDLGMRRELSDASTPSSPLASPPGAYPCQPTSAASTT